MQRTAARAMYHTCSMRIVPIVPRVPGPMPDGYGHIRNPLNLRILVSIALHAYAIHSVILRRGMLACARGMKLSRKLFQYAMAPAHEQSDPTWWHLPLAHPPLSSAKPELSSVFARMHH